MTVTLTGFYPWTDLSSHATSDLDYRVTNYHSQTSSLPSGVAGVPQYTTREIRLHYRQPNGVLTGSNAYLEGAYPDSLDWNAEYDNGANQAHIFLRDGHGVTIGGLVMDGGWDGVRTSTARATTVQDCAFIKLRDDVIEYDSSLNDIASTHTFRRNLCVGFRQCISSRPGEEPGGTPIAPLPGNRIVIQDSIFVAQQGLNSGSYSAGLMLKRRNDTNGNPVPHDYTNCIVAYDKEPTQSEPTSHVALAADTVSGCTFVWLGSGSIPTKFGLANNPGGWTVISGTGAKNHLGVTGTSALDWLENYITAWLNVSGTARLNLRTTIRNKVNFNTVLSGSDRHIMLPGLQAKVQGTAPAMTAPFDFPAGPWAIGVFTRLNDNSGSLFQYLLSIKHPTANFPQLNLFLFETANLLTDSNGDPGTNRWAFLVSDNAGTSTGTRSDQSGLISDPVDSVQRLLVLQNTGSAIELWACAPGDTARRLINHTISLGALTFSGLGVSLQFGRRYDGNTGRYYEEEAGGLFKIDSSLTQGQIQDIASGDHPEDVASTTVRAVFPFLSGPVATEFDEINGLTATRVGTFAAGDPVSAITSRNPTLYISGAAGLTDSSGNGRAVTQQGGIVTTGESMSRGNGIRLNGAHIRVDNPASSSFFAVDTGAMDLDVQCEFAAGMDCIIPAGVLTDNLVLMSMDNDETAHRHGWVIWAHSDRSVELQVRQPWQPARMRSPTNVITAGVQFHIQMVLGRDGMMLYLDGKRLEDGIKNSLVWHGLDRRERNTQSRNTSHFRVGATGTSANSDIIVGHIFAFVRNGHANELLDADCQAIAGGGGTPHPHRIWRATTDSVGPGTNVIQGKIDTLSSGGGGRLLLSAGTYTQSVNLNLKSNVEIVGTGSGSDPANNTIIQLTNNSEVTTIAPNINTYTALTATVAETSKTLSISGHGLSADDVLLIMGNTVFESLYTVNGQIRNSFEKCSELLPVERILDSNAIRVDRKPQFSYTAAQRETVGRIVPIVDVGLRNLRIQRTFGGTFNSPMCEPMGVRRLRLSNVVMRENGTSTWPKCFTPYGCVDIWTDPEASCTFHNVALDDNNGTNHPYNFQLHSCRGVVAINCVLHGGGWHAMDAVGDNIAADFPGTFSSSNFLLNGHLCVVDSIITGGGTAGDSATSRPGTRVRLNTHGGVKHSRFFNITMPRGGGIGFGGGYQDIVDVQGANVGELPNLSFTYGAWRAYVYKYNHAGGHATQWFDAAQQAGVKASMRDCVFSNVTRTATTFNNHEATSLYANNTARGVTAPIPTSGFSSDNAAPPDPMT